MIEELYKLPDGENIQILRKILSGLHENAASFIYTDQMPTASTTPNGKVVIYDDGAGTKRIYIRTGKGNIGFIALT